MVRVAGDAVAALDEGGYSVAYDLEAFAFGISAEPVLGPCQNGIGRFDDVFLEHAGSLLDQSGVFAQRQEAPRPRQRCLAERLGVPDVAIYDAATGALEFLGAGHHRTPHGVLGLQYRLADVAYCY